MVRNVLVPSTWDTHEVKAYLDAGGGWKGINAVIKLNQRRFYENK